jgi:hypothetical protein
MCSLRFENNFLIIGHVHFRFENICLAIERVRFASKIIFFLYIMCSLRFENNFLTIEGRCSLRFDIEENTIIEPFIRFRFASVAITRQYLKLSLFTTEETRGGQANCFSPNH